jgi:hypothetical protein
MNIRQYPFALEQIVSSGGFTGMAGGTQTFFEQSGGFNQTFN